MPSPSQRAANRANSLKSTGPRTRSGKLRSSINATKHGLSLPLNETLFGQRIRAVAELIKDDCADEALAFELAKRIIDYERNEAYLIAFDDSAVKRKLDDWIKDPHRGALVQLLELHRRKQEVSTSFTTPKKKNLNYKERTEEMRFIEAFMRLQERVLLNDIRHSDDKRESSERYQRRAINQLVKGVRAVAKGA